MDAAAFVVTRQNYSSMGAEEGEENVVEIAQGGHDYSNPGMLVPKYRNLGEGDVFRGMTPAVEAAMKIAEAWKKDRPDLNIQIASGFTHGCTMPFEPDSAEELKTKAAEFDEALPKCERCGDPLPAKKERYRLPDYGSDEEYCSENCADRAWEEIERLNAEDEEAEEDEEFSDEEE